MRRRKESPTPSSSAKLCVPCRSERSPMGAMLSTGPISRRRTGGQMSERVPAGEFLRKPFQKSSLFDRHPVPILCIVGPGKPSAPVCDHTCTSAGIRTSHMKRRMYLRKNLTLVLACFVRMRSRWIKFAGWIAKRKYDACGGYLYAHPYRRALGLVYVSIVARASCHPTTCMPSDFRSSLDGARCSTT